MGIMEFVGALLCAGVGGGIAWVWARRIGVTAPLVVGMAIQATLTVSLFAVIGLWAPDAITYDHMGRELASSWQGGPDPTREIGDGKEGFPAILGGLYFLFGSHPSSGLALNWAAHALLVVTVAATAQRLDLPTRRSAWIAALFPPVLLWGGLLLREALTWLLLALIVFGLVSFARSTLRHHYILYGAVFAGSVISLTWIRGTAALIVGVGGILVLLLTSRRRDFFARLLLCLTLLAILTPRFGDLVGSYLPKGETSASVSATEPPSDSESSSDAAELPSGAAEPSSDSARDQEIVPDRLAAIRDSLARDSTTSFGQSEASNGFSVAVTGSRVLLGPFPWEWQRTGIPLAVDALLWLGLLTAAAVGTWRSRTNLRMALLVVVPAGLLLGALVVTSGNYGTMQRLRVQSAVLLIPLAAAGCERRRHSSEAPSHEPTSTVPVLGAPSPSTLPPGAPVRASTIP